MKLTLRIVRQLPRGRSQQGAPFQLFLSADEAYVVGAGARAAARSTAACSTRSAASCCSRRRARRCEVDATLDDLKAALADGRVKRFAIANPGACAVRPRRAGGAAAGGPVGGMRRPGWCSAKTCRRRRSSRRAARRRAASSPTRWRSRRRLPRGAHAVLLPEDLHAPLRQRMVLVKGAGETAQRFRRLPAATGRAHGSSGATALCLPARDEHVSHGLVRAYACRCNSPPATVADPAAARHRDRPRARVAALSRQGAGSRRLLALPLVLPPTVLGFYLLVTFGGASPVGRASNPCSAGRWCSASRACCWRR